MRQQAKAVNFGIIYGQQAFGLSQSIGISRYDAKQFIDAYFKRFPLIGEFLERLKSQARKSGRSVTLTGRERLIPEINSKNGQIRIAAERLAINSPLQGTAADIIKMAMLVCQQQLIEKGLKSLMVLQIHDELLFECPDEELPILKPLVKEAMEEVVSLKVPLVVDISIGRNWRECYS
jgi:DNA polymerase-1